MNTIFADTGYWIALFNPHDYLHAKAVSAIKTIQNPFIVTSQMVLAEFLNYYASLGRKFRYSASQVVRSLQQNKAVEIIPQTDAQFEAALMLYFQRQDKEWSLVDCSSFLIMREQNITEALSHDEHFRQAGFIPLLRNDN